MSQRPRGKPFCQHCIQAAEGMRFSISGLKWLDPRNITVSFAPDRTPTTYGQSNLYSLLNRVTSPAAWQAQIKQAFSLWQAVCGVKFFFVPDSGQQGGFGACQGDPRFGDIRICTVDLSGALAATIYPPNKLGPGNTDSGNIHLSTRYPWRIDHASRYDLKSVLLHEIGHALGLNHSTQGTVMYGTYTRSNWSALTPDDVAGARKLYGPP